MDESKSLNSYSNPAKARFKNYTLRFGKDLYIRLNKHIQNLKSLQAPNNTIQKWITEAIQEQIEIESKLKPEQLARDNYTSFKVALQLAEKIENNVNIIRLYCKSFSKKQWFAEAFYAKLEREEEEAIKLIKKRINNSQSKIFSSKKQEDINYPTKQ